MKYTYAHGMLIQRYTSAKDIYEKMRIMEAYMQNEAEGVQEYLHSIDKGAAANGTRTSRPFWDVGQHRTHPNT